MKRILVAIIVVSCCWALPIHASLTTRINSIVQSKNNIHFGVRIVNAKTGRAVYERNAKMPLIPASNMKVITSAAALHYLGGDFDYITKVGVLGNTLVVIGSGDPLLGDQITDEALGRSPGWIFDDVVSALKRANVGHLDRVIVDSTVFDDERVHSSWPADELNRDYSCEVCGINYNGNSVSMTVTRHGNRVDVAIEPQSSFITLRNQVRPITSGSGAVGAYRIPGKPNVWTVKGKCFKQQGPVNVAIEKPAAFLGYLLAEQLGQRGIPCTGQLLEGAFVPSAGYKLLASYRTPLTQCLKRCNTDSFNLAAECLAKTIGAQANNGSYGSWALARERMGHYLQDLGLAPDEYVLDDASGLSRENKLSARVLSTVLHSVYHSPDWPVYKGTLAVGGVEGTLDRDFREARYKGKILGKTGYIRRVRAFSGVCQTEQGDYLFSILANGSDGIKTLVYGITKAV
ncbi:MAG: D-alanyl-D-alanine carboxypeptidase/D-alanyl-D-alanine-endopeptidase, partial [Planctomycetes bacterium]|nr:D-alanyl-D-alanine carboxypeptidase/D-alanyl-D-alanine-endopeptidase [Planctomycetota bacterium]